MLCRGLEPSLPRVPSRDQRLSRKSLTRAEAATASRPLTPHPSQQPIRTNQTSALPGSNGGGPTCARSGATEREGTQSPCLVPAPCPSSCFYPPPRAFTVDASLGAHAARIATTARVKQQGPALHTRFSHPSRPLFRCPGRRTLLVERVPVSWQMARLLRSDYVQTRVRRPQIAVQVNSDPLLQGSGSTFLLFFWTTLTQHSASSRMATIRRPDSASLSGGYVAVDYRPPLVPAILSTSGRIHSELHSRALHLAPPPSSPTPGL